MKIVYMGTPDFAVKPLEALHEAGHNIALVVTKADRPKDRGKKMQACPVKLKALELGLDVESPEKIKGNEDFLARVKSIAPDIMIVAAYGKILPVNLLEIPRLGCVNIHGSLLPKYRGAAPIQRAVINGESETGVTLMYMAEGMDTGDMIAKAAVPVGKKTAAQLFEELSAVGSDLLMEYLPKIENGTAPRIPQNEEDATYAPMVFKEEGRVDFSKDAKAVCSLIRGFNDAPIASTIWKGEVMKLYYAVEGDGRGKPGEVLKADKNGIEVACGSGSAVLKTVQMPGKKAMEVSAFLAGNKIEIGSILG